MSDWEELKRSIARVTANANGEVSEGTGFYIGDGFALTALHVVADTTVSPPVLATSIDLQFGDAAPIQATLADGCWDAAGDWAALKCARLPNVPALEPVRKVTQDAGWRAYGFPAIHDEGLAVRGEVSDPKTTDEGAPAIQLECKQVLGQGAPLHGLSGAPCLIDGKVAGILRATLTEVTFDGKGVRRLYTQAGTIYATPSNAVMGFRPASRGAALPDAWRTPGAAAKDFLVVLSSAEDAHPVEEASLQSVARTAQETLRDLIDLPHPVRWSSAFESRDAFLSTVEDLCRARIVVFDATGFEPAIMLLAGVRSVVRRGITILSVGKTYALGDALGVPFNITDANIMSHSENQGQRGADPVALLEARLRRGLKELELPTYLDNPVYDAIRRLPEDRRGVIPAAGGVLVLCPFEDDYNSQIWDQRLRMVFEHQLKLLRQKDATYNGDEIGVARSFELNSARLVTQALYENIRRAQACVVDLTHWSPNVLFELGVRLASNRTGPSCLLARDWLPPREELKSQCDLLASLFVDREGYYDRTKVWRNEDAYRKAYGVDPVLSGRALSDGSVHRAISTALDIDAEPASRPVYRELMDSAALFSKGEGDTKPVGLYPGNAALTEREEAAEFERLMAAWLYVYFRPLDASQPPGEVEDAARQVGNALRARHFERIRKLQWDARPDLLAALDALSRSETTARSTWRVDATALRNDGKFDQSLELLDSAIEQLTARRAKAADAETSRRLQEDLAEAYGMKGGVHRRHLTEPNHLDLALESYQEGCRIERVLEHSTYNSSNVITLAITHQKKPLDSELRKDLERVIKSLERETKGKRSDEFYAWADLAQFYLLRGDESRARDAYREALNQGPSAAALKRHIEILRELAEGIRASAPDTADSITAMARELEDGSGR